MRNRTLARACVAVVLTATAACHTADSGPEAGPSEDRAHATFEALRARGVAVDIVHTMRDAEGRFAYLRVRHSQPQKISRHYGITPAGEVLPIATVQKTFAGEHRARWGNIGLETATRIVRQSIDDSYAFAAWYDPHDATEESMVERARQVDPHAQGGGGLPVVYFEAPASTVVRTLAREPAFLRVASAEIGEASVTNWPADSAGRVTNAITSRSESAFTDREIFGEDIPVGMVELIPNGCGLYDDHEAFQLASLDYQVTPLLTCTTNADCVGPTKCGPTGSAACQNGKCVLNHLTGTASRISSNLACGIAASSGGCEPGTTSGCPLGTVCDASGVRCEPGACDYENPALPGPPPVWQECNGFPCSPVGRCVIAGASTECYPNAYHASKVSLYVANNSPTTSPAARGVLDEAYQYFVSNDVYIVNESYVAPVDTGLRDSQSNPAMIPAYVLSPFTHKAALTDYYARKNDILFVQAAGNSNHTMMAPAKMGIDTLCSGFNGLCVGSFDAFDPSNPQTIQPGSLDSLYHGSIIDYVLADGDDKTRWANPVLPTGMRLELSKPDVMAEGENASSALHDGSPWEWGKAGGTSVAAPVVAGLAALFSEACFGPGVAIHNPAWLRAVFRTAAWDDHHLEFSGVPSYWPQDACAPSVMHVPQYPTADGRLDCDYKAGAGVVNAENLLAWCDGTHPGGGGEPESDCVPTPTEPCHGGFGGGLVPYDEDPTGWTEIPEGLDLPDITTYVEHTYTIATRGSELRAAQQLPQERIRSDDLSNYAMFELTDFPNGVERDFRVRGTMSYYSCPGLPSEIEDGELGVMDYPRVLPFDYAFCGRESESSDFECLILSEGLHETNEGFDFIVPKSLAEAATYLIAPRDWTACPIGPGGVGNDDLPAKYERVEEALRVWYP